MQTIRPIMKKMFLLAILSGWAAVHCRAQLIVNGTFTPQELVDSVLLGPGVRAYNIQYTGHPNAVGFFNGTQSNMGLDSGIILTTGTILNALGPNNNTMTTGINQTPGDSALSLIAGQPTRDAAILEFDFVPSSDTVKFRYVFASEEYYEGVCTPYNDVFAFLISGPSISGVQNIALIPNTNLPVTISSVNEGIIGQPIYQPDSTYPWCYLNYTPYYVDNSTPPGTSVEYDGFTVVLTAKAVVVPCQTYHIRLAIADGGNDDTWDSGVFLEAGSFNSRIVAVSGHPELIGATLDSAGMEGCSALDMIFTRFDSIAFPRTLNYVISGTAMAGVDYTVSSPNISFLPGEDTFHLYINPTYDAIAESMENVTVKLIPDFIVCSGWDTARVTGYIVDAPPMSVSITEQFTGCPFDSIRVVAHAAGGALGNNFTYTWSPASGNDSVCWVPALSVIAYTVTATDSCGQQTAVAVYTLTDICDFDMPNVITPDGDGVNDYLILPDEYIASGVNMEIFNRWGNSIYQSDRYDNSWNAASQPDGTYYYLAVFVTGKSKTGFVTVVR